ncbi:MAG TPA: adenylate/guanylate cyclase domain-containing protein [Rhabdochlamydiaceae bacterium]|nr:adenylate/guanylate cyclase domain-containing protein [Rhabdochlamydiaceae bacterium]
MDLDYFKHRKLRFDILTIFLGLFAISFAFVISFTYLKNSQSILKFSKGEVERASSVIVERINALVEDVQLVPLMTQGILENLEHPTLNNPELKAYMQDFVENYKKIYAFYIGKSDGSYIEVSNLFLDNQTHYLSDLSKPLPKDALYSFRFIDRSKQIPTEHWEYKNEKMQIVAEEDISPVQYDPRQRPWYVGAKNTGGIYWTDIYEFTAPGIPTPTYGITIADPVFNESGELLYVIGVDLTLLSLETFLAQQKIGKTGEAFILNRSGNLIIPRKLTNNKNGISQETISKAFSLFSGKEKKNFIFESNGVKYLAYIKPFPVHFGKEWLITIIVPLNDFFADMIRTQTEVALISIVILILAGIIVVYVSKKISTPIVVLAGEIDKIRQLDLESKLRVKSNIKEIQIMDSSIAAMRSALASFGRYVPKEIVKQLILKEDEIVLGGEKKEITVFFSDIAGFTSIAETVPTDLLMSLLTDYFGPLSKIILENGGTIDKYIGDSIMAFWNAPLDVPDHPIKACQTALLCGVSLRALNQRLKEQNKPQLPTRIGINTGKAFIGNIGTPVRMNYTAIGDVVNIAERLEQIAKEYHVAIVISDDLYQKTKEKFLVRPLDHVAVKGRKEKIKIYELVAEIDGEKEISATKEQIKLCTAFTNAYEAFYQDNKEKAHALFESILEQFPGDFPTQLYLERLKK